MLRVVLVAALVALAGLTGGTTTPASAVGDCAAGWMMGMESFEQLPMEWCPEGPMSAGVDTLARFSYVGSNNAYLQTATPQWNALRRHVPVPMNSTLCLTGWVRTMGYVNNGYFGVRVGRTGTVLMETRFGASEAVYRQLTPVRFDSGSLSEVTIFVGHWSPSDFTRLMIDAIELTPTAPDRCG